MSGRLVAVTADIDSFAAADRVASVWVRDNEQAREQLEEALDYVYRLQDFRQFLPKEQQEPFMNMVDAAMNLGEGVQAYLS